MMVETSEVVVGWTMHDGESLLLSGLKPEVLAAEYEVELEEAVRTVIEEVVEREEQAAVPGESEAAVPRPEVRARVNVRMEMNVVQQRMLEESWLREPSADGYVKKVVRSKRRRGVRDRRGQVYILTVLEEDLARRRRNLGGRVNNENQVNGTSRVTVSGAVLEPA